MALPVVPILAAFAGGMGQVLTKPWPWVTVAAWFAVSRVDFGVLRDEARDTIFSLWWLIPLIFLSLGARQAMVVIAQERGKTRRHKQNLESKRRK